MGWMDGWMDGWMVKLVPSAYCNISSGSTVFAKCPKRSSVKEIQFKLEITTFDPLNIYNAPSKVSCIISGPEVKNLFHAQLS